MKILKQEIINGSWWAWIAIDEGGLNTEILQSDKKLTEQDATAFLIRRTKGLEDAALREE